MDSGEEEIKSRMMLDQPELKSSAKKKKKKKKTTTKEKKETPAVKATIQVIEDHPERALPLVGYFPSGFNANDNTDAGESSSTSVRVLRNRDKPKRLQLVVTPPASKVNFVGTNYSGEAEAGQQNCSYALGVLDKATQSLKIVPIASDKIFRLEPKVGGLDFSKKEPEDSPMEELSAQQKANRMREELTNRYGTNKSRKEIIKMKSLKQADDPDSLKDLDVQIKKVVVNKDALESTDAHNARNIPPYNSNATTPEEAYPLDKIIGKEDWRDLEDIYELLQGEVEVSWDAYPAFIFNRIHKLRGIQDEAKKKKLSCIFSYMTYLMKFKEQHPTVTSKSRKRHNIPNHLNKKFSTLFDCHEVKNMSREKHDLLISYVLVLTLYADEFKTDFSVIAEDLKMNLMDLRPHYEHLGCKINKNYATLSVPLQFPQTFQKRRRR